VQTNKSPEDLVWDWDAIAGALTLQPPHGELPQGSMDFLLGMRERFCAIAAHGDGRVPRVWVIVAERSPFTRQLQQLGAVFLDLDAPESVCRERLAKRGPGATRALDQFLARTTT